MVRIMISSRATNKFHCIKGSDLDPEVLEKLEDEVSAWMAKKE